MYIEFERVFVCGAMAELIKNTHELTVPALFCTYSTGSRTKFCKYCEEYAAILQWKNNQVQHKDFFYLQKQQTVTEL